MSSPNTEPVTSQYKEKYVQFETTFDCYCTQKHCMSDT